MPAASSRALIGGSLPTSFGFLSRWYSVSSVCVLPPPTKPSFLVEETLHQLLLLVAIQEDFADGLSDEPEGVVTGVTTPSEELDHPLRLTLLPEGTHTVEHVDEAGRGAIGGRITEDLDLHPLADGRGLYVLA